MAVINPYLTFNGNCEEAFLFYKSAFGGEFPYVGRFKEMPPMDGKSVPTEEAEKIMHISLPISKETILMGSDTSNTFGPPPVAGSNFSISITADSQGEADKLFNALAEDGSIRMPMDKTFWGSYFGMLTDKFGIAWMISFDEAKK
ncbi:VOC family protein [soil metagenome]